MKELAVGTFIAALIVAGVIVISATVYDMRHASCGSVAIEILAGNVSCEVYSGRIIEG